MLFMVGVERPKSDTEAFGIIVPVFDKIGYGCFSAADTRDKILHQAKDAIITMAQEALLDGHLLDSMSEGYTDYSSDPQYSAYSEWFALEVDAESLKAKQKRINIVLPEPLIARIDSFVSINPEYKDRSDFLAKCADRSISNNQSV